jgi:hypothetical protein
LVSPFISSFAIELDVVVVISEIYALYPPHCFPETLCVLSIIKPPVPLTTATPIAFVSA